MKLFYSKNFQSFAYFIISANKEKKKKRVPIKNCIQI